MSNIFIFLQILLIASMMSLISSGASASAVTLASDVAALSAFKSSITPSSINPWSCLASWNFTSDPCHPLIPTHFVCGLTCTDSNPYRISSITLDPAGYSGTLSPSSLSNLSLLSHLHLPDNSFRGPIPSLLPSSLTTLILSSNSLSGPIPLSLSNLPIIQTIDLSRNSLTGPIPRALPPSTLSLDLSFNRLSGAIPTSLPANLVQLALRGNSISGTLNKSPFQSLKYLEVAELAANKIQGKVEGWFFLLPSLQQVDLANNSITSVEVGSGSSSSQIVAMDLSFNRIGGELPAGFARFPLLASLSARHNRLRGQIPWEYGKVGRLKRLFLDGNFLNGEVPDALLNQLAAGSFGDNCFESCPTSMMSLCSPVQKPDWLCRRVYGPGGGRTSPRRPSPPLINN